MVVLDASAPAENSLRIVSIDEAASGVVGQAISSWR
jgi:hypothetical protein